MPSNKELIEEAKAIAAKLGLEVTTEGLNNAKLTELVADLKAKEAAASGASEATKPAAAAPTPRAGGAQRSTSSTKTAAAQPKPPLVDGAGPTKLGGPPPPPPPPPAPAPRARFPYAIAPGKSITSRKGVLGPGEEVLPRYFNEADEAAGMKVIEDLVAKGYIVKAPDHERT